MKLRVTRTSSTLFVYDDSTAPEVEKQIKKLIRDGESRHMPNGDRVWETWEVIYDSSKEGSAAFQWDKSGGKVKCRLVRCTLTKDKKLQKREVRQAFRAYDSIFE